MTANTSSDNTPETQDVVQENATPGFGWTQYAEKINGRFAMVGFIAVLVMELFTQQDFFTWIGLR